ncbi:unnamed protein product [Ceratitis capitata]|uniref:(Mediterranean fruit fly) hypothetical protein n=1 Tax=Ceratitis capitata TaxID=7213 RepID=A0A811VE42_CERCA|nr:unnamed protein product [Ceratitis capitata]
MKFVYFSNKACVVAQSYIDSCHLSRSVVEIVSVAAAANSHNRPTSKLPRLLNLLHMKNEN